MTSDGSQSPELSVPVPLGVHGALPSHDPLAADLRGFGPLGLLAILAILFTGNVFVGRMIVLPIGAVLVLVWTWRSRTPWRDIGYVRPRSWIGAVAVGLASGIAFKFAMKAIVMPLLGADPVNQAYHFLAGNSTLLPAALWGMVNAGFSEETVFRGYFFERLGKVLGHGVFAKASIVLFTSAWFGLDHYPSQGLDGVAQATIVGLVFGGVFALTGRIFMLMCAHAAFDLTALAIIYLDRESDVAHLVFR